MTTRRIGALSLASGIHNPASSTATASAATSPAHSSVVPTAAGFGAAAYLPITTAIPATAAQASDTDCTRSMSDCDHTSATTHRPTV
ncbi:Uncharacterised protein [Mycobacteroides abscessus subsp. abscessus]|nr:Uncharacterised protein [Mycobacteroides abscessus subsp. abscessus]